jgi:hypothetical protein
MAAAVFIYGGVPGGLVQTQRGRRINIDTYNSIESNILKQEF